MSKWSKTTLGEVATVVSGSTPKTSVDEYWNGEYNWVTPAELNDTTFVINDTERKITSMAIKRTSLKPLPIGTVLLSSRAPIGKVAIVGVEMYCNQGFKNFICSEKVYNKYLFWYLKGKTGFLNSLGRGATFKEISKTIVEKIEIPLPPFETQKQIAKTLDTAAELLAMRKQQLAELDNLIKSTFYDMFGDPVANEKGWEVVKLSDFYEDPKTAVKCGPFGSALKKDEYVEDGVPVWVMDNITKQGEFKDNVYLYITKEKFNELSSYNVRKNDIIISRAGTVGKMCVVTADYIESIISTNLIRLRLNQKLLPMYLVKLITIWGNKVSRLKTGDDGTFTHMNTGVLDNINFPFPPIELQNQFAAIVTKIEEQKALVKKAIDETQYLFDSLMSEYFE